MVIIIVVPRTPAVMPFPAPISANRICATFDIGCILQDRPNRTAAAIDHLNDGWEHHPSTGLILSCTGFRHRRHIKFLVQNDIFRDDFFRPSRSAREIFTIPACWACQSDLETPFALSLSKGLPSFSRQKMKDTASTGSARTEWCFKAFVTPSRDPKPPPRSPAKATSFPGEGRGPVSESAPDPGLRRNTIPLEPTPSKNPKPQPRSSAKAGAQFEVSAGRGLAGMRHARDSYRSTQSGFISSITRNFQARFHSFI